MGTNFWPWQLVTYMFLHGGFWHIFFNMLMLWMFGMELEYTWGSREVPPLLPRSAASVRGSRISSVAPLLGQVAPTIGASGAVFGILIAFGMLLPDRPIYVYFLLPITGKVLHRGLDIGLELFTGVTGSSDGVAHFAHLGGAAVGFRVHHDRAPSEPDPTHSSVVPAASSRHHALRPAAARGLGKGCPGCQVLRYPHRKTDAGRPEVNQEVIDAILDKISKGGYQSLTERREESAERGKQEDH